MHSQLALRSKAAVTHRVMALRGKGLDGAARTTRVGGQIPRATSRTSTIRPFHTNASSWGVRTTGVRCGEMSRMSHRPTTHPHISVSSSVVRTAGCPQIRSLSDLPVKTSSDGVVGLPINFDVASKIDGNESQVVTINLAPGQVLRAESGAMMFMTDGVTMETTTGGGMGAGFKRMLTGQNIFISDYRYDGPDGTYGQVALGTDFPSKILRLSVGDYGGKIVCQKGALLCASHTIDIEMEFTKNMTSGFFGGEGFVLQALTGEGDVFVKAGGTLIRRDLDEGEKLRISSGCLVAFTQGVDYGTYHMILQQPQQHHNVNFVGTTVLITNLNSFVSILRCSNDAGYQECHVRRGRSVRYNVDWTRNGVATRTTATTNDWRNRPSRPWWWRDWNSHPHGWRGI
jgi:uncharacterized protein (AIM24 family)